MIRFTSIIKKKDSRQRVVLLFLVAAFIVSSIASLLLPAATQAATITTKSTLKDQVYAFSLYNAMVDCLGQDYQQADTFGFALVSYRTSEGHLKSGDWWMTEGSLYWGTYQGAESQPSYINPKIHEESGNALCNDIVKAAAPTFGYSSIFDMACSFIDKRANDSSCKTGSGDFKDFSINIDKFKSVVGGKIWSNGKPSLTASGGDKNAGLYLIYREAFLNGCSPKASTSPSDQFAYKDIRIINDDGSETTKTYEGTNRGDTRNTYRPTTDSVESKSCGDIASLVNQYAKDFKAYLKANPTDNGTTAPDRNEQACNSSTAASDPNCANAGDKSSCSVEGIGWMLCPVANAMAGMTDAAFAAVSAFMNVSPLSLNPNDNPLYTAWATMRSVANVAFVIVFLIIIFSQLSSVGVSNYGVKKMLPRLIIAAILVNLSFFICAIAVDISNILGVTLQQVFKTIEQQSVNTTVTAGENWGSITSAVLGGASAAVVGGVALSVFSSGGIMGALAGLLPLLVGALFALIIAFLVLLARQALIIMLIVLAPLALVAYLLPNTESLFKKWRDLLISLLALFPMLSIVFGSAQLAAGILRDTSQNLSKSPDNATQITAFFLYIGSFAVQAIPFFITPLLIKLSGGVLGRFAGLINNPNKGPFDRAKKRAQQISENQRNRGYINKLNNGNIFGIGARRRARRDAISSSLGSEAKRGESAYLSEAIQANGSGGRLQKAMAGQNDAEAMQRVQANAINTQLKLKSDEVSAADAVIEKLNLNGAARQNLALNGEYVDQNGKLVKASETMQKAAVLHQLKTGSFGEQSQILQASHKDGATFTDKNGNTTHSNLSKFAQEISQNAGAVSGKDPAISGKRFDQLSQADFKYETAIKEAIGEGKYTAETFATMNNDARNEVIRVATEAANAGDPKMLNILQDAARGIRASVEISGKIRGNADAEQHIVQLIGDVNVVNEGSSSPATSAGILPLSGDIDLSDHSNNQGTPKPPSGTGSGPGGMILPGDPGFNSK